jgi:hypothetical protein
MLETANDPFPAQVQTNKITNLRLNIAEPHESECSAWMLKKVFTVTLNEVKGLMYFENGGDSSLRSE